MMPMAEACTPAPANCLTMRATAWASAALLAERLLSCLPCPLHPACRPYQSSAV